MENITEIKMVKLFVVSKVDVYGVNNPINWDGSFQIPVVTPVPEAALARPDKLLKIKYVNKGVNIKDAIPEITRYLIIDCNVFLFRISSNKLKIVTTRTAPKVPSTYDKELERNEHVPRKNNPSLRFRLSRFNLSVSNKTITISIPILPTNPMA